MFKFLLVFLVCIFGSISNAGTIDPRKTDTQYIEYGKKFIHVGKIYGQDLNDVQYSGSCVAYSDRVVLTAAHILHDSKNAAIHINDKDIKVNKWIIHENFEYKKLGFNDIAICFLEEDIGLGWYPSLYKNKNEVGQVCSLSGYGSTGTFITGPKKQDDIRRAGSNLISTIENGVLMCDPSMDNTKTQLEFFICPGDSGGGLFIDQQIAGIHSYTMKFMPSNKQFSGHTRVSNYVEWINNKKQLLENNK
jgi:hypothetical protein